MNNNSSKKIVEILEELQKDMTQVKQTQSSHTVTLANLKQTQSSHTVTLANLKQTQSSHTMTLANLKQTQSSHTMTLSNLKQTQSAHTASLAKIEKTNKVYSDMYKINNDNVRKIEKRTENLEDVLTITPDPENILMKIN